MRFKENTVHNLRKSYKRTKVQDQTTNTLSARVLSMLLQMPQHGVFLAVNWINYVTINCSYVNYFIPGLGSTTNQTKPFNSGESSLSTKAASLSLQVTGLNNP